MSQEGLDRSRTILSIQLEQGKGTTGRQVVDWRPDGVVDEDDCWAAEIRDNIRTDERWWLRHNEVVWVVGGRNDRCSHCYLNCGQ